MWSNNDGMDPNWRPTPPTESTEEFNIKMKMERDAFAIELKSCRAERDEAKTEVERLRHEKFDGHYHESLRADYDTLRKQLVVAVEALKHGYVLDDGKAYIRSKGNVPMEMNAKSERIVRKALVAFFHLNGLLTHFASERHAEESTAQQTES